MSDEAAASRLELGAAGTIAGPPADSRLADSSSESPAPKSVWKRRFILAGVLCCLIAAALVLPPLVNIGRYQGRVTALMSRALGRPVRLSSVELRLLPLPGFVLHDLSVGEDPGFGAEPVLSARTVVARVAFLPLWTGKLEISRVSVDEGSLNLVRNAQGRWNLESLMMGVKPGIGTGADPNPASRSATKASKFPYLEATNSRVNLKNGIEKSPFSVVNADLSLWQDEPGAWRVRLKGQPARTDLEMSVSDTGEVRLEASLRTAGRQLRDMPLQLQLEWRDAELGQLSRLVTGSDAGWRGEMTADIDVNGSPESAQTRARLRATGVRREEFAPDTPLDFDANCNFRYQHSQNAFHAVSCDTAIGNGHLHLAADLPGLAGPPEGMLEVQQIPVQAGLDLLRTLRNGFAPGITARGVANGSLTYKQAPAIAAPVKSHHQPLAPQPAPNNLTGAITIDQAVLSGGGFKQRLVLPRMVFAPVHIAATGNVPNVDESGLATHFTLPADVTASPRATAAATPSAATPSNATPSNEILSSETTAAKSALTKSTAPKSNAPKSTPAGSTAAGSTAASGINVNMTLAAHGFNLSADGAAGIVSLRDLAYAFGAPHLDAADSFAAGSANFTVAASGPWVPSAVNVPMLSNAAAPANGDDTFTASLELHHAQWSVPYLAQPVDLPLGTVAVAGNAFTLNSEFSFGQAKAPAARSAAASGQAAKDLSANNPIASNPIEGTVEITAVLDCKLDCAPKIHLDFGSLDATALEAALLSPPQRRGLLSPILDEVDRIRSTGNAKWPRLTATTKTETLILGPNTLHDVTAELNVDAAEITIPNWQAQVFGGSASGTGHFSLQNGKPQYAFESTFTGLNPAEVGERFAGNSASNWSGGALSGSGKIQIAGLVAKDLAASAAGEIKFTWLHGAMLAGETSASTSNHSPTHFDSWTGTAQIAANKLQLGPNTLTTGRHTSSVSGSIPFAAPAKLTLVPVTAQNGKQPAAPKPAAPSVQ
jgi:predicted outer membrane repeat protein